MSFIRPQRRRHSSLAHTIGQKAVRALYAELMLYPKPGLVSPVDSGAHDDMDVTTFMRSLVSLRHYFVSIAAHGAAGAPFHVLQSLGLSAEKRMLDATDGINTHRGAIFCMGLLAAAAGWLHSQSLNVTGEALADTIGFMWAGDIAALTATSTDSNGGRAIRRYGGRGARDEALVGFPTLMNVALPILQSTLESQDSPELAMVQSLFAVMAHLDDTNLLHRGGPEGLTFVQTQAKHFLIQGGVFNPNWRSIAFELHQACIARHLSPGGAADMLAAAWFVQDLQSCL